MNPRPMVERSSNAVVEQWLKIIGGSLLTALGLFLLLEAFISLELWQAYTKDGVVHEFGSHLGVIKVYRDLPILDNVPLLVLVGVPSMVIGIVLVIRGTRKLPQYDMIKEITP